MAMCQINARLHALFALFAQPRNSTAMILQYSKYHTRVTESAYSVTCWLTTDGLLYWNWYPWQLQAASIRSRWNVMWLVS